MTPLDRFRALLTCILVEKKQKEHVLTELSSQHIIAKPVVATSGCAFTIGEVGSPNMRRLPPRLPPIHQKNNRKTIDRQTIESNLKKAENNKQVKNKRDESQIALRFLAPTQAARVRFLVWERIFYTFFLATIEFNTRKVIPARGATPEGAREESSYYGFISWGGIS